MGQWRSLDLPDQRNTVISMELYVRKADLESETPPLISSTSGLSSEIWGLHQCKLSLPLISSTSGSSTEICGLQQCKLNPLAHLDSSHGPQQAGSSMLLLRDCIDSIMHVNPITHRSSRYGLPPINSAPNRYWLAMCVMTTQFHGRGVPRATSSHGKL